MRGSVMYLAILAAFCASLAAAAIAKDELYCPPTNGVEDVLHPKAENCSEFYKCNYGELVTIPCPAGLLYCAANKWCDYPDNCDYSNCKISPVKEDNKEEPNNNGEQNNGNQQVEGGDQNNYGDLYCPPELEGSDILYSQPDNCNEFYQCYYGKLFKLRCQQGLYYCPTNKWCDYAENCDYAKYCKMPSSVNVPQEGNKNDQEEDVEQNNDVPQEDNVNDQEKDVEQNNDVPQEGNVNDQEKNVVPDKGVVRNQDGELTCDVDGALYPNPDNCNEFYQCASGRVFTQLCPASLFYCASKKVCDYPDNCVYSSCRRSLVKLPPITLNKDEPIYVDEQNKDEKQINYVDGELYCPPTNGVEDVLHPKAENCSEFYKCNYGELVTIPCPAGLLYCAANKWCDYPDNCDYSNCKISSVTEYIKEIPDNKNKPEQNNNNIDNVDPQINNNDELYCPPTNDEIILYPKPENCSEFYQCSYGYLYTHVCQPGLYYCAANQWCDFPDNCDYSNCQLSSSVNIPPQKNNTNEQSNDAGKNSGAEQNGGVVKNENGELSCNDEGALYPNPDNCNEFYQCASGRVFTQLCPAGLFYCASKKVCDYPDNCVYSSCRRSLVKLPPITLNKDEPIYVDEQNKDDKQINYVDGELYCPPTNGVEDVLHPKAENCSEFYKCNYGELVTIPCPAGLLYCAANKWCDYPDNCDYSNCKISSVTEYIKEIPDNKNKPEQNNNNIDNVDPQINNNDELYCPPTNDEIILYPKPENCSEFYQCSYGYLYTHVCQPGLYYCAANQWCDFPDNCDYSNCQLSSSVNIPPQKNNTNEQSNDAGKNSGAEQNGGVVKNENGELSCNDEGALYPNPDNCNEFYQCASGRVFTQLCPAGLYYCGSKKACDYPDNCDYSSCKKSLVKLPSVQGRKDEQVNHVEPEKDTPLDNVDEQKKNTKQESAVAQDRGVVKNENGELFCPLDIEEALYPNPDNCNEFYQCSFGHVFVQRCIPGLYYCASKQWCDYADNCDYRSCKTV